jgi:circadian clock protein KaiC
MVTPKETVSTGIAGLDEMMHGGIPRGSVTLVAGGSGTGKTLISLHFAIEGARQGEPGLLVTFQETPDHLKRIAAGFGWDLQQMIDAGLLRILYTSPVEMHVDEHTRTIQDAIDEIGAKRVVVDSLMDIQIATPDKVRFRDYVYSLATGLRSRGITSLFTNEIPELFGPLQLSSHGISFISDNVILLRYVEIESLLRRGISVMKMRGQDHDKAVREFTISGSGMQLQAIFGEWASVLTGQPAPYSRQLPDRPLNLIALQNLAVEALARSGRMSEADLGQLLQIATDQLTDVMLSLTLQGFASSVEVDGCQYYEWKG